MDALPTAGTRPAPLSALSWGWVKSFAGKKRQWQISLRTWWPNMVEHQWLRASNPKGKREREQELIFIYLFFYFPHWILTLLCYFILTPPLQSHGSHKAFFGVPYSHHLQDPRGFLRSWIWNPIQPRKIMDNFSCSSNFKAANLCKRKVKMSGSFQGIDLKSFHLYHLEWMLPR